MTRRPTPKKRSVSNHGRGSWFQNEHRSGLSLIEVIMGILLLATLLTGLLMSWRRHLGQIRLAQRRSEAIAAADQLLAGWFAEPQGIPVPASGPIPSNDRFTWRTRVVDARLPETLGCHVVRLAIHGGTRGDEELISVDLLAPVQVQSSGDQFKGAASRAGIRPPSGRADGEERAVGEGSRGFDRTRVSPPRKLAGARFRPSRREGER